MHILGTHIFLFALLITQLMASRDPMRDRDQRAKKSDIAIRMSRAVSRSKQGNIDRLRGDNDLLETEKNLSVDHTLLERRKIDQLKRDTSIKTREIQELKQKVRTLDRTLQDYARDSHKKCGA